VDDCDYVEVDMSEEEVTDMDVDNIYLINTYTFRTNIANPKLVTDQQFEQKCLICHL